MAEKHINKGYFANYDDPTEVKYRGKRLYVAG